MHSMFGRYSALILAAGWAVAALGNNMRVTNTAVVIYQPSAGLAQIRFDIAWENSWRYTNINHDAAWVFFKAQKEGETDWKRVMLAGTGTNPAGYSTGTGTVIELIVPNDGVGVFVRRAVEDSGAVSVTNVRVVWNFITNGLTQYSKAQIQTLAIEMVYVAEGSFQVGDGTVTTIMGQFEDGTTGAPFSITNEAYAITLGGGSAGSLGNNNATGMITVDDFNDGASQTLPAAFPKGYAAFYCMKYEITQGQYTDFLNLLTATQVGNRYQSGLTGLYRYTIGTNTMGQYTNGAPDWACNHMHWSDGAAFADWAGLRPLTELEFEKACRGPLTPVTNEFAWGSTNISQTTAIVNDGTGTDTATDGNCNYLGSVLGAPYRVGIYATASSSRTNAGASYWGIMELSGNLWERWLTVGHPTGRLFTGLMGDGTLTAAGYADVSGWPGTDALGAGLRGGDCIDPSSAARVSDREYAAFIYIDRSRNIGWRGGRTAPSGVGP